MSITASDIIFRISENVSNLGTNGGKKGTDEVQSGVRHSLFPRVTKAERINGVTRYRKQFWCNENEDDDTAYGVLQWLETISNADDRFYLRKGTQDDNQDDLTSPPVGDVVQFTGTGALAVALTGGESQIQLNMESNDYVFENGGYLHISDKIKLSQAIASNVSAGDSVVWGGVEWAKISATTDIVYPNGIYLGSDSVLTLEATTSEEWVTIAEMLSEDVVIGTGNGSSTTIVLTDLTLTNEVCRVKGKLPVLSVLNTSDTLMTVNLNQDGTVNTSTSYATAGELNMVTGEWAQDVIWSSAPKSGESVLITYRETPFSFVGNLCTISLDDTVSNTYAVGNTMAGGCVYTEEIKGEIEDLTVNSTGGTFDDTTYPITVHNLGASEDTITVSFISTNTYNVIGTNLGTIGTGVTLSSFTAINPDSGENMFTLLSDAWGGSWQAGDSLVFNLHPSAQGIWMKEVVPAGAAQEGNNLVVLGWYGE